ncbi:MAG: FAD/NAD(P)-binding protein [Arenicellales bacterium]
MHAPLVIVGSGFAAAAAVVHLVDRGIPCRSLTVIGPATLGTGQAYGCVSPFFRLNVRPDIQRLWPDQPDHFPQWANQHITDPKAHTPVGPFYRRSDFARYVADQLKRLPDYQELEQIHRRITHIRPSDGRWILTADDQSNRSADRVVLATGNPDPQWPADIETPEEPTLIRVPWRGDWLEDVDPGSAVCLVGSGLTAMDALYALSENGHRGPIYLLSPFGLLPPVQLDWKTIPAVDWPEVKTALEFIRVMRHALGDDQWLERRWQERFEALRIGISLAWQRLPVNERLKLMRRLGWLWSLQRFRASPQTVEAAERMIKRGQLVTIKASMTGLAASRAKQWMIALSNGRSLSCETIINCTGAGRDALIDQLVENRIVGKLNGAGAPSVNARQEAVAPDGTPLKTLFVIGASTGLALGDVVGSTSIARQAARLTDTVWSSGAFQRR